MSGLHRPGPPPGKKIPTKRASSMRPPLAARARSGTPAVNGRASPADSVVSMASRVRASPGGTKRKERDYEHDGHGEETNINVVVRCRGRSEREVRENSGVVVSTHGIKGKTVELSMGPSALSNKTYQFDKVFSPAADQTMIFDEVVAPILDEVLSGFNCTIFAYGQTGTGKTYTMSGDISDTLPLPDAAGIVPRILYSLFGKLDSGDVENSVKCSFIELYNEELRDLLSSDDNIKLKIFEDNKKGHSATLVQGMEESHIKTASKGIKLLREGSLKRQVAATKCNDLSSRSHTVFTVTVYMKRAAENGDEYVSAGKLNLVDLAGSENIQRSGAENKRAAEAGLINKSLLTLGRVINALVERSSHIPYRESKLTRLLQDSLGGRTKTCIIATLSPAKSNLEETISTLDYAFRAKNIRNKPQVNQLVSKKTLLKEFTIEIEKLKSELIAARQRNGVYLTQESYEEITTESESRRILAEEQRDKLETMETNLRNKVQELFYLTTSFNGLKKDHEAIKHAWEGTKGVLEKTELVLDHTKQKLIEEEALRRAHQKTEGDLAHIGYGMISTLEQTTSDIDGLRSKIRRKSDVHLKNRQTWTSSQSQVLDITSLVEDRIGILQAQQTEMMDGLSTRMHTFVKDSLEQVGASQSFLEDKIAAFDATKQEVSEQTYQSRDEMHTVLEEIRTLREDVKQKVGAGLDGLSAAAQKISAGIMTELEAFQAQLHSSYASLGRDFKNTFDGLIESLNAQHSRADALQLQTLQAGEALAASSRASQTQLFQAIEDEKHQSAREREHLVQQMASLIDATAVSQERRLNERMLRLGEGLNSATEAFTTEQRAYNKGMDSWAVKSQDILAGVSKSRDNVKAKIKGDFAAANTHATSMRATTASVHESTTRIVSAQMSHMDTQLHSLDDIVSRIRTLNDDHQMAHLASLGSLSSTVQSSQSGFDEHLLASRSRIEALSSDMSAQTATLKETLPTLSPDAAICAPLRDLRDTVGSRVLQEYCTTGETPARTSYTVPRTLPHTDPHETLLASVRDDTSSGAQQRGLSKGLIFPDAVAGTSPSGTRNSSKPGSRSGPTSASGAPSLREIDVNTLPQEALSLGSPAGESSTPSSRSKALPLKRHKTTIATAGKPSLENQLPGKRAARKTTALAASTGLSDRENLSDFSASVGPLAGRRLRSHGNT